AFIIFTQRKYHYLFSAITLINFILLQSLFNKFEPIIPFSIYFYYFDIIALFFILTSAMTFFLSEIEAHKQIILDKNIELLNQTKLLEQTDLIRTKLFSIISHDLRSPIAGFKSLLHLFEEQEISTEEFGDYIKQLKEQTGQLSATLDQLLHWSQIQLKGIQTNRTHFNLTKIIQEEYNLLAQNMLQKSIKYTFH